MTYFTFTKRTVFEKILEKAYGYAVVNKIPLASHTRKTVFPRERIRKILKGRNVRNINIRFDATASRNATLKPSPRGEAIVLLRKRDTKRTVRRKRDDFMGCEFFPSAQRLPLTKFPT